MDSEKKEELKICISTFYDKCTPEIKIKREESKQNQQRNHRCFQVFAPSGIHLVAPCGDSGARRGPRQSDGTVGIGMGLEGAQCPALPAHPC